jgi:cobalt ECF transporter T component CbiQ
VSTTAVERATPGWLVRPEIGMCPCGRSGRRRRGGYLTASLDGIAARLHLSLGADELAAVPGWLQRLDPRPKLVGALALLVAVGFARQTTTLLLIAGVVAAAAATSRIPLGRFLRRVWLTVPLFTAFIALPAMLDVVTPGPVLVQLGTWFGHPLSITAPGVAGAVRLVARTGASVSVVLVLTMTTPWHRLLAALGRLHVPTMFVVVLSMAWRYVFLLTGTVTDLFVARRARGAGATRGRDGARQGRTVVAATAGTTLSRSHQLSGDVYLAMVARGYTGPIHTRAEPARTPLDAVVAVVAIASACLTLGLDRLVLG